MAHWFFLLDIAALLFIHANCQVTISDWTCGLAGPLTYKFREFYSDTNTTGFCKTSTAPIFGLHGTSIWVVRAPISRGKPQSVNFSESDIYAYVNNQDEDCITFDPYEYLFSYWHDCEKYTGDSSQLSEIFTVGPTANEQTSFTIELDSCEESNYCGDITVSCGGVININQNLLDKNKGACDTSDAPQYGTIGIYDANSESWVTKDLHGLVTSSSSDDCLNYNESNYTVYYIHDCNSYDDDEITDLFDLGINQDSQIVVKIDNNCQELFANESYTCGKTSSAFTSLTEFETIDFECSQNSISISSLELTQYNIIFKNRSTHDLVLYTRNLADFETIDDHVTLIDDQMYKWNVEMTTLYESDTFIVAWKTRDDSTNVQRVAYVIVDPTSENAYDDVTNDNIMFADNSTSDSLFSWKRHVGISSLTNGNFVIVWSQRIDYVYWEVLFSIIDPTTNELVVSEEIVATGLSVEIYPWSVIASIEGYFMISWTGLNPETFEIHEYARIYDNDGVAIRNEFITSLGYFGFPRDASEPKLVPLAQTNGNGDENYFLLITHCMNQGYRTCIRIYDSDGSVKTINGDDTYFARNVEGLYDDYATSNIYGMTELNDGSLMVLYTPISDFITVGDLFEIEVISGDFSINWEIDRAQIYDVAMNRPPGSRGIPKGDLTNANDNKFAVIGGRQTIGCGMQLWTYEDKKDADFTIPTVKLELKYHFGFMFVI
eukprot:533598_1